MQSHVISNAVVMPQSRIPMEAAKVQLERASKHVGQHGKDHGQ